MKQVIKTGNPEYSKISFSWHLTNWCNYNCTYCSTKGRMVEDWQKSDSISKYKLVLSKLSRLDTDFGVDLFGGEPTLHPNIEEIVTNLKAMKHCKSIQMSTNLSRSLNFYKKLDVPALDGFYVSASYHPEYADSAFVDKVLQLQDCCHIKVVITVILSDQPKYWPQTLEFIELLKEHNIQWSPQYLSSTPFWQSAYGKDFYNTFDDLTQEWTREMTDKYTSMDFRHDYTFADDTVERLNYFEIHERNLHKFKGYTCNALMYEILVDGSFVNLCTGRVINRLIVRRDDFIKQEVCPRECCDCETMFNYYKELK